MSETYSNVARSQLTADITSGDTSLSVTSGTTFPTSGRFRVIIGTEIILVDAISGGTLSSLTRGAESTTAAAHLAGVNVTGILTKGGLDAILADHAGIVVGSSLALCIALRHFKVPT